MEDLEILFGGVKDFNKLPDAIFVVGGHIHQIAIKEAKKTNVPVIAIVNTDDDLTNINYPIAGTYLFNEGEPIVELNENGTGFYQLHGQPKRPINWGIECEKTGETLYKKGFNTAAYSFWYQFLTTFEEDTNLEWNLVPFTIHFNTLKMYIQGERVKSYKENDTKN